MADINSSSNRITGVSDFIHRPDFNNYKKKEQTRRFGNWIYPSSKHVRALEKIFIAFFLVSSH
jgi:hypothetical protein